MLRQEWSKPPLPLLDTGEASTLRAAIALGPGTLMLLDDLLKAILAELSEK